MATDRHKRKRPIVEELEGRALLTVFHGFDRQPVADTTALPWRTVGRTLQTFPDGTQFSGTGVMVDRDHVLTAGHCVYDPHHGGWATSIEFLPAQNGGGLPYGTSFATSVRAYQGWTESRDYGSDLALVTLDRSVGLSTGWMSLEAAPSRVLLHSQLHSAGYPADEAPSSQYAMAGPISGATPDELTFRLDVSEGQSGSPIWRDLGRRTVVDAVITSSDDESNYAARITRSRLSDLRRWMIEDRTGRQLPTPPNSDPATQHTLTPGPSTPVPLNLSGNWLPSRQTASSPSTGQEPQL